MSNLADASVTEGTGGPGTPMEFVVTLSQQCANDVSIDWTSAGSGAHPASGTDYAPSSGTVTIPAGHTSAGITVTVVEDGDHEDDETFTLTLTPRSGLTLTDDSATGTIVDDDPAPGGGPIPGKIVFVDNDGTTDDLYSIDPDGTDKTRLTDTDTVDEVEPDWGYGTEGIVYSRGRSRSVSYDIWAMDADGSNQRPITTTSGGADRDPTDGFDPTTVDERHPVWSPDYEFVAFHAMAISAQETDGDGLEDAEIFMVEVATGSVIQITHNEFGDTNPAWSPDGNRIAYERGQGIRVRSVMPDPAGGTDDAFNPDGDHPDWGWVGTAAENWLLYDHDSGGDVQVYRREVGGTSSEEKLTPDSATHENATWSPDGARFAYLRDFEIYVQDATAGATGSHVFSPATSFPDPDWGVVPVTARVGAPPPIGPNPVVPISLLFLALGALGFIWVFWDGKQRSPTRGPAVACLGEGSSSILAGMPVTGSSSK